MEINKDIADIQAAEASQRKKKKFILCYHNFNVKNYKRAAAEIRKISEEAGSPISIAVVPSIGGAPESEAEEFREEIGKFMDEGYEIILHGARHRADLFVKRSFQGKIGLWLSSNGAEFAGLGKNLSQSLLTRALALWKAHGFGLPSGFVAPVWFGNKFLKKQVLSLFDNYEDLFHIYKKTSRGSRAIKSPLFTFSIFPKPLAGLAQTIALLGLTINSGTPRLVFHAGDFQNMGEDRVLGLVRYAKVQREKVMYRDL
ncbi:MAG: DUF2334 domain-containing protein [Fibrobacter sp.]|nr:DUF2334 domain-containing protein [Fibrobacter sp.]